MERGEWNGDAASLSSRHRSGPPRRAALPSYRMFEPQCRHRPCGPCIVPVRPAAVPADVQPLKFPRRQRLVRSLDPVLRTNDRPVAQHRSGLIVNVAPRPKAAPTPVLGTFDQAGRLCFALDVSADTQKMVVPLDRKTLEPSLIERPLADRAVSDPPSHRMGMRHPTEERSQFAVIARPDDEVPMIAHQAPRKQPRRISLGCFDDYLRHRLKIFVRPQHHEVRRGPIDHMVHLSARCDSRFSCHPSDCNRDAGEGSTSYVPVSFPP